MTNHLKAPLFIENIEKVQYSACFIIAGAFKGTSRERFYQKLVLDSLKERRWFRKLGFFYKIVKYFHLNT